MARNPNSLANLTNRAARNPLVMDDTISSYAFLLGARLETTRKGIFQVHVRRSADLYRIAEYYFNLDVKRPTSRGDRPGQRMTGRFTFGTGGAFRAVVFKESENLHGIGFPDMAVADRATDGVWRVHEFGLPSSHPEGPRGQHILPSAFHWDPSGEGRNARLVLGRDPKDRYRRRGSRNTRKRRSNTERLGQGVPAKNFGAGFAEIAMQELYQTKLEGDYREVISQSFGRL